MSSDNLNSMYHFNNFLLSEQMREAEAIDSARDELLSREVVGNILGQAITTAHIELEADLPNDTGIAFGYIEARDARRWWVFRSAYMELLGPIYKELDATDDPQRHGLDTDRFENYAQKMRCHERELVEGGAKIVRDLEPIYINTYATLEAERVRRENAGDIMLDPLQLEYDYSILKLQQVLDNTLNSPLAIVEGKRASYKSMPVSPEHRLCYEVNRIRSGKTTTYLIQEHRTSNEPGDTLLSTVSYGLTHYGLSGEYELVDTSIFEPRRPTDTTTAVLDLAANILRH